LYVLERKHRWILYAFAVTVLLLLGHLLNELDEITASTVMQALVRAVRNVIHVSLLISWCVSLQRRIMNVQVRRCLVTISILMIFWLTAKVIKYEFLFDRTFWLGRYIWYSYYIPMILIPLLGVFIIDHMGKPEEYRNPRWMNTLYIPAFAILFGIFTNDLHQLAFDFPEGIEQFDYTYSYGPVYFAAMAWFVLLGIYFVIMLLKKSRVPGNKKMQKLPVVIMGGAVVFWTLYCLKFFNEIDLTVFDCLILALLLESAIQSGTIPSNTNYHAFFRASTVAAQIVNFDYQPCFVSATATSLTTGEMKQIGKKPVKTENKVLHSASVKAGYVLWEDDVTQIHQLMTQLQDVQEQLGRENELLQAELKLKEQQAQLAEQKHLFNRIMDEVAPQIHKLEALLAQASSQQEIHSIMAKMCMIGSNVKRRSNLVLLEEENPMVTSRELEYCIRESLDNLQLASVSAMLDAQCEAELPMKYVIAAYDFYENLIEKLFDQITAVMVHLSCKNGILKMKLQLGCTNSIADSELADLPMSFGSYTCSIWDEDVVIDFEISEGGGDK